MYTYIMSNPLSKPQKNRSVFLFIPYNVTVLFVTSTKTYVYMPLAGHNMVIMFVNT
jgi:hypothetical protein